jgi:hypothetical protein
MKTTNRRMRARFAHVGADLDSSCKPPASIDPAIAAVAMQKLHAFMARGALYGAVEYQTISGVRYAFRYSLHPPDAGISSPHPGVDYLVCSDPNAGAASTNDQGTSLTLKSGLPALAIVGVFLLVMAKK